MTKTKYKYTGNHPILIDGIGEVQPGETVEFNKEQENRNYALFKKVEKTPEKKITKPKEAAK
jgi:hypothetical protein